jgi:hypothetical protein
VTSARSLRIWATARKPVVRSYVLAVPRRRFGVNRDEAALDDPASYALASSRGSVTVPGVAMARRVASARYAPGSTPTSFADSSRV